jgi:hypothetical protein
MVGELSIARARSPSSRPPAEAREAVPIPNGLTGPSIPASGNVQAQVPRIGQAPRLKEPEIFKSGTKQNYDRWSSDCQMHFDMPHTPYPDDPSRISFALFYVDYSYRQLWDFDVSCRQAPHRSYLQAGIKPERILSEANPISFLVQTLRPSDVERQSQPSESLKPSYLSQCTSIS